MPCLPPRAGSSYISVLLGLALITIIGCALFAGFAHGQRLARLLRQRTALLNVAQAEMERARGMPFEHVLSHPIDQEGATGEMRVELLSARRKRIWLTVRHPSAPGWPVQMATERCL